MCECALEVDKIDRVGGIATSVVVHRVGQIDDRPPPGTAESLAGLVGGDRDQPSAHLTGFPQRVEAAPGDRPGDLHRIPRRVRVPTDHERDAGHRGGVLGDEPREGGFIPVGRAPNRPFESCGVLHDEVRHVR